MLLTDFDLDMNAELTIGLLFCSISFVIFLGGVSMSVSAETKGLSFDSRLCLKAFCDMFSFWNELTDLLLFRVLGLVVSWPMLDILAI